MSILIIGGNLDKRKQTVQELIKTKYQVSNFDTVLIEGETSIGIEQIRTLEHQAALKPYNSPFKAIIIHPGELLTIEAQNALLKTLEEANDYTIIILTASHSDILLPTIVSRCQIIKLPTIPEITLDEKSISAHCSLLKAILKAGVGERLKIASQIGKSKEDIESWLNEQLFFWHHVLIKKVNISLKPSQIIKVIRDLEKTRMVIESNVNPRLALEIFLLDLPRVSS
ncbi:MAG: hypothetical protein V1858_02410 [Candidatus Gottesmanbacteria bacterium]